MKLVSVARCTLGSACAADGVLLARVTHIQPLDGPQSMSEFNARKADTICIVHQHAHFIISVGVSQGNPMVNISKSTWTVT